MRGIESSLGINYTDIWSSNGNPNVQIDPAIPACDPDNKSPSTEIMEKFTEHLTDAFRNFCVENMIDSFEKVYFDPATCSVIALGINKIDISILVDFNPLRLLYPTAEQKYEPLERLLKNLEDIFVRKKSYIFKKQYINWCINNRNIFKEIPTPIPKPETCEIPKNHYSASENFINSLIETIPIPKLIPETCAIPKNFYELTGTKFEEKFVISLNKALDTYFYKYSNTCFTNSINSFIRRTNNQNETTTISAYTSKDEKIAIFWHTPDERNLYSSYDYEDIFFQRLQDQVEQSKWEFDTADFKIKYKQIVSGVIEEIPTPISKPETC